MKITTMLFAMILFFSTGEKAAAKDYVINEIKIYTSTACGIWTKYTYTYNKNNQIVSWYAQDRESKNKRRTTKTYDNRRKLLSEFAEAWLENEWRKQTKSTYTYDDSGNCLTLDYDIWKWGVVNADLTITKKESERKTYTYNNQDSLLTELWETGIDDQYVDFLRRAYSYNSDNYLLVRTDEFRENNKWEMRFRFSYKYDSKGNQTEELQEGMTDDLWLTQARETHSYGDNNRPNTFSIDLWRNDQWEVYIDYAYTYDEHGRISQELEDLKFNENYNRKRKTHTYDSLGRPVTILREEERSGSWVNQTKNWYIYNYLGNMDPFFLNIGMGKNGFWELLATKS